MHSPKGPRVLPLAREGGGVVQPDGWRPQREMRACGTCPGGGRPSRREIDHGAAEGHVERG